mmetsp:Transcript_6835/g.25233  ORF Transcript_6835/g.25233 Transcript_6835/m.25233 type:complete len:293 (+) Transcript_6835:88-966(+)
MLSFAASSAQTVAASLGAQRNTARTRTGPLLAAKCSRKSIDTSLDATESEPRNWFVEGAGKITAAAAAALVLTGAAGANVALAADADDSGYSWPFPSDTQRRKESKSWSFGPIKFEKADWDNYAEKGEYVEWVAIKDGETVTSPLEFAMLPHGVSVSPATSGNLKNFGHFYVIVDGGAVGKGEMIPTDATHFNFDKGQLSGAITLPKGSHSVTLQFADASGASYGEKLSNTITLNVVDPESCGDKDLFCYRIPAPTEEPTYSGAPQETETCLGCGFEPKDVSRRNLPLPLGR